MIVIEYSPQAVEDMRRFREYMASNWGENTAKKILGKCSLISED